MTRRFLTKIESMHRQLNEAPGDELDDTTGEEELPDELDQTADVPTSALPEPMDGEDDPSATSLNYIEMIRKALIMAPKHIDDVDYAKLTKVTDTTNLEEMEELVTRIVRTNYPHPNFEV